MNLIVDNKLGARNRNTVEVEQIYPNIAMNNLNLISSNTILGVSFDALASEGTKILAIWDFLKKQGLNTINIFIGDSLYRYTAMIKRHCSEIEANEIGIKEGMRLQTLYAKYSQNYKTKIFLASEIEKQDNFLKIYKNFLKLFDENKKFKAAVLSFADLYFSHISVSQTSIARRSFEIECSCKYLMEELAIFAIFNQAGFNIFVYPGVLQTLCDVINMNEPYLNNLFENYIFVSLRLNRR